MVNSYSNSLHPCAVLKTFHEIKTFTGLRAKIWSLGFETGCADQPSHKEHVYTIVVFSVRVIPLHILPSNSFSLRIFASDLQLEISKTTPV
jgi:hypothetical protein